MLVKAMKRDFGLVPTSITVRLALSSDHGGRRALSHPIAAICRRVPTPDLRVGFVRGQSLALCVSHALSFNCAQLPVLLLDNLIRDETVADLPRPALLSLFRFPD